MQPVKDVYDIKLETGLGLKRPDSEPEADALGRDFSTSDAAVRIQRAICWAVLMPLGGFLVLLLKYFRGYRIEGLHEIRKQYREIRRTNSGPLLICANHLTFIDSALIIWALGSVFWYSINYKSFTWNLPAGDFFKKKLRYHVTLYLMKCIFLHRDGSRAHKNSVLDLCARLMRNGDVVQVFPEGQRSRSGRFDSENLRFGAGKILTMVDGAQVLCIYLRSPSQEMFSNYPKKGSHFRLKMRLITPILSGNTKKESSLSATNQIGATIKGLEDEYFSELARS